MPNCKYAVLAIALFLTACAGVPTDGDGALVVDYSPAFQQAAAAQYQALAVSCRPNDATTPRGCSALKTMINDYRHLRARLRAE